MKAILLSLGTRGDIEPFLAIAEKLDYAGYEVICAFPLQFQKYVDEKKYRFYGLSEKFLELIEGEKAKMVLGGKGHLFQKLSALIWMIRVSQSMQKEVISEQHDLLEEEQPDIVIYNQKCLYPMVWGMKNPGKTTLLSPLPCTVHEFTGHAALGMGNDHGHFLNKLTYRFSNFFLFKTVKSSTKRYHRELGLKLSTAKIKEHILYREKMIYTISPVLFPRPADWPENAQIVGYHEKVLGSDWQPSEALKDFISQYKKIVFITFGSMTNPDPGQKTKDILAVLAKHQIPAIINTASGGLIQPHEYPGHVFFTDTIPYEWILPKMYAVVHHGGSGTTHTALKCGCTTMIIPHILDQHLWNDIISQMGLGPKGIPIKKFNAQRFESKLLEMLQKPDYKNQAEKVGERMRKEDHHNTLMDILVEHGTGNNQQVDKRT